MNEKLPLNSLHLKLLAVVTMLIDHMGFTLFPHAVWMRAVGRLAFPIFCFLIAEGCAHTHDKKRYAGRLLLFAVLSELPFNLMCSGQWISWNYQNVLWTLLIGAAPVPPSPPEMRMALAPCLKASSSTLGSKLKAGGTRGTKMGSQSAMMA